MVARWRGDRLAGNGSLQAGGGSGCGRNLDTQQRIDRGPRQVVDLGKMDRKLTDRMNASLVVVYYTRYLKIGRN